MTSYDHIVADDSRCWCGPAVFHQEETITEEMFPGMFAVHTRIHVLVAHYESSLAPRRHGHPRKPKHIGLITHL